MASASCQHERRVDAHFAGKIAVDEEAQMRRHLLDGCPKCRHRYTRLAMLAKVDRRALPAEERLASGLGLSRRARVGSWVGLFSLLAGAVMALLVWPRFGGEGFQARGEHGPTSEVRAELLVFRVRQGGDSERLSEAFSAPDRLAFAYRNPTAKRYLYVFGVDEHGHVYWYAPAWTDPTQDPAAAPARQDAGLHEMEKAVGHHYDGTRLAIHGLLTDRAWRVKELEKTLANAAASGRPLAFDGAEHIVRNFVITP